MSVISKRDAWGRLIAIGTGTVFRSRNGEPYMECKSDTMTNAVLSFIVNCAYRKHPQDPTRYKHQVVVGYEWEDKPIANIIRQLEINDLVHFSGVIEVHNYIAQDTGQRKKRVQVHLEWLQVIKANGEFSLEVTDEQIPQRRSRKSKDNGIEDDDYDF